MATTLEYVFSLQDKMSAKIGNITVTSDRMLGRFADLERRTQSVNRTFSETGRTIGSLREKIALLQAEREWIPAENLEGIRAYNREMNRLNREIAQLESLNGGKFKKWSKEAFAAMPGSNLISNPLVAGAAAIGFAGKSAMNYDEGMAKVNITAQLDEKGLSDLSARLRKLAKDNHTDITVAPEGLEKIISQVGDAELSMQILDASIKGSKAGFTELDVVSGALAQSLSVIGAENTNVKEVLDTFFAAKRVGAGEFADFARYMPGLIAGASNMGINFKEVAGTFAYMTGKGQSAERAAVLMENAFSVLGKADIRGKMEKAGVKIFDDQGKMRGMVDIFTDLKGVLNGMTDEQKSSILEKFGLVDKEAKNAFALMTSDLGKLQEAMDATSNSAGETNKAIEMSQNPIMKATELWNDFKNIGLDIGIVILPVINVALEILSFVLQGVAFLFQTVLDVCTWWGDKLKENNPIVWGLTTAIAALSAVLLVNCIRANATIIALAAIYTWDAIVTGATWLWTTAQWALNAAMTANPIGIIIVAIGALIGIVIACWNEFEGFRQFIFSMWEVIKEFGSILIDAVVEPFKQIINGIGAVGDALMHLMNGDFKKAGAAAKEGFKDIAIGSLKATPMGIGFSVGQNTVEAFQDGTMGNAWDRGQVRGTESYKKDHPQEYASGVNMSNASAPVQMIPGTQLPAIADNSAEARFGVPNFFDNKNKLNTAGNVVSSTPGTGNQSFEEYMKKLEEDQKKKGGKGGKKGAGGSNSSMSKVLNLNDDSMVRNLKSSADYTAITKKLAPTQVNFASVRKMAAAVALPLAMASATPSMTEQAGMDSKPTGMEQTDSFASSGKSDSKTIHIDRMCDQIVIHIQNTDGNGVETIRQEVIKVFNEIYEV